ncbi:FAD-dependent monooxygenase [Marinomonas balearica]|uniref:Salicylate hydroxylase n=1 Tax=Marinomonas balearica TaxID=491947 RepID=A0A4R6M9P1_9GAMM|nr:FAD-dependent monooxygenase [Marinomonas balearica]TDO98134.1 salicylate hydroxylase [Marinomonas balearica]
MVKRVVISGAGIGGLAAALACAKQGFDVTVLEQAHEIKEVGAGLQMSPNAMKVLQALGVSETLADAAFSPKYAAIRHYQSGAYFLKSPLGGVAERRYQAPYWHLHRADLIHVLYQACLECNVEIKLNCSVTGYKNTRDGVIVFTEKYKLDANILVGADGIKSTIRKQMKGDEPVEFTGQVAWRGTINTKDHPELTIAPEASVWAGPGKHLVTYYLRGGELINFVAVEEKDTWRSESWRQEGDVKALRASFSGWHPTVTRLLDACDASFIWALNARPYLDSWCDGRTVLLGDACHPMLPFMAQGAAMAIEDAYVLSTCLKELSDERGLLQYQEKRLMRTREIQEMSKSNTSLFHMHGGMAGVLRLNAVRLATRLIPSISNSKLDPLYGYDATKV